MKLWVFSFDPLAVNWPTGLLTPLVEALLVQSLLCFELACLVKISYIQLSRTWIINTVFNKILGTKRNTYNTFAGCDFNQNFAVTLTNSLEQALSRLSWPNDYIHSNSVLIPGMQDGLVSPTSQSNSPTNNVEGSFFIMDKSVDQDLLTFP